MTAGTSKIRKMLPMALNRIGFTSQCLTSKKTNPGHAKAARPRAIQFLITRSLDTGHHQIPARVPRFSKAKS